MLLSINSSLLLLRNIVIENSISNNISILLNNHKAVNVIKKLSSYNCYQRLILLKSYDNCLINASNLLLYPLYRSSRVSNIYFVNKLLSMITKFDSGMRLNLYQTRERGLHPIQGGGEFRISCSFLHRYLIKIIPNPLSY